MAENKFRIWPSDLGCNARRKARRVASHIRVLQRRSAPKADELNVEAIDDHVLNAQLQTPPAWRCPVLPVFASIV